MVVLTGTIAVAQDDMEINVSPTITVDTIIGKGFAQYRITITSEPDADIYYKIMTQDDYYDGTSDTIAWESYSAQFTLSSENMDFKIIEAYAISDGKLRSPSAYCYFDACIYSPWDFEQDGIYYAISDDADDEVLVTYYMLQYQPTTPTYTGDVVIPAEVTYGGIRYTVTGFYGEAFVYCGKMTSISLPNTIRSIGFRVFEGCSGLKSVKIPDSVTKIEGLAFSYCTGLTSVEIPNSVTSIEWQAFLCCKSLTSIEIPNSVSVIECGTFSGCENLASVTIPESMTSIDEVAFADCYSLKTMICKAVTPPAADHIFYSGDGDGEYAVNIYDQATLFVPNESIEAYRNDLEWGKFTHIVPFIGAGPGDVDGDGHIVITDVIGMISLITSGAELPAYCDVNGDGEVNITDITTLINMIVMAE